MYCIKWLSFCLISTQYTFPFLSWYDRFGWLLCKKCVQCNIVIVLHQAVKKICVILIYMNKIQIIVWCSTMWRLWSWRLCVQVKGDGQQWWSQGVGVCLKSEGDSLHYKTELWGLKALGIYHTGRVYKTCFWVALWKMKALVFSELQSFGEQKSGYLSLCHIDFGHSF